MKPDLLADVQGVDDDHLFDDAPQGVGARQYPAVAQQAAPPDDEHLFDDAPQGMSDSSSGGSFARGVVAGAAPAVGGLAGAGIGAEVGACQEAAWNSMASRLTAKTN
jgi:hypothetical protein